MTDAAMPKPVSQNRAIWQQFRSHKGAVFGLIVLGLLILFVLIGPLVWVPEKLKVAEAIRLKNQGPSLRFPLGTDQLGRDMLSRMMLAGRISLAVGLVAMLIAIVFGTLIGVVAGYYRRFEGPLMRLTDMFLALPLIPLLLVLVMLFRDRIASVIGPELGAFALIVFAIGITSWMATARIVRGEVLTLKEREYVLAARSIGARPRRIILRHILPNVVSPVMVAATLGVAEAIITESVLSFLGLGFPPDFPTWGRLLFDGLQYMQVYPERVIWPGLAISLTVLSVNYIGDGLRDALDPRIRGR
ncbi:MAG: ABC transporter permease [Tabrizicola sp.]|uniref:ABC transporter permease n=1 Tax=Tabrizicola sp. TaxID=2005166 RepID=UPI002733A7BC|nr:ABC transporter permease [Tabrizicola sp.]MDP3263352.1 ABC transporter permease [Tabrizicola sp.]MDP3646709.1 ABC transporter permease [Paracoccaceae bacterium]MDZ4067535.1 ABC transporter permease [Tabrizicola sp.]